MRMSELENKLREHAEITKSVIETPFEFKKSEVQNMKKFNIKTTIAVAAAVLLIIAVRVTPFADSLGGYFKDIKRWDGAITGTKYENATNDIKIEVMELTSANVIPLELTFENPTQAPFPYIQEIEISDYKILDSNNKEITKEKSKGTVSDGKVLVNLLLKENLKSGEQYTILIEKMYGLSKADAPLHITGYWECKFVK